MVRYVRLLRGRWGKEKTFFSTEGKMNSVTQSIHSKCQCVIDCASLAPRCCSPSDQYHHYPNYAASYSSVPGRWSLFRRGNAGTGERMGRMEREQRWGRLLDSIATARTLVLRSSSRALYYTCCCVLLHCIQLGRLALLAQCFMVRLCERVNS